MTQAVPAASITWPADCDAHPQRGTALIVPAHDDRCVRGEAGGLRNLRRQRADDCAGRSQFCQLRRANARQRAELGGPGAGGLIDHRRHCARRAIGDTAPRQVQNEVVVDVQEAIGTLSNGRSMAHQPGDGRNGQPGVRVPAAQLADARRRAVRLPGRHQRLGPAVQPGDHGGQRRAGAIHRDNGAGLGSQREC